MKSQWFLEISQKCNIFSKIPFVDLPIFSAFLNSAELRIAEFENFPLSSAMLQRC
jgi:hypothetical protein